MYLLPQLEKTGNFPVWSELVLPVYVMGYTAVQMYLVYSFPIYGGGVDETLPSSLSNVFLCLVDILTAYSFSM